MRKILLSAIVIISFLSYAVIFRPKTNAQTPVITPNTIGKRIVVTPTVTPVLPTATPTTVPTTVSLQPSPVVSQQPTDTPQPTAAPTATPQPQGQYKDGTYSGSVADAFYGLIQVQVTVSGGKITNVQFLQAPNDNPTSSMINQQADPMLAQEAIQAQSANVNIVSGATDSSQAFMQSMQSALTQAKN